MFPKEFRPVLSDANCERNAFDKSFLEGQEGEGGNGPVLDLLNTGG